MRQIARMQSRVNDIVKNDDGVTLTLETVFMLILCILALSGIWYIVMTYIIGDGGGEEGDGHYSFGEVIMELMGGLFG